jgi:hypothetical protein
MTKDTTTLKLTIHGKYDNYTDFYAMNKNIIYNNIIDLFECFKEDEKKRLVLKLSANIENIKWKTDLEFTREEIHILKRDVLPYFEELEEYETCERVINLCKLLE